MAVCHEMKEDQVYFCEDCGLELKVVKECKECGTPEECSSEECTFVCCNKPLKLKGG